MKKFYVLSMLLLLFCVPASATTDYTTAACTNGVYRGLVSDDVLVWLGVPYAKAPEGALRWKAPVAPDPSNEIFSADTFASMPLQRVRETSPASLMPQGEDCLALNVYKASSDSSALKPVIVFVHGGSFRDNGTSEPEWFGEQFVRNNPEVMFVNIGFRHGLMGFIDFSEVPGGSDFTESGNLGLLDLLQGVRWLKENAEAFGGDPDNITLMGQSSGSAMVSLLMTMPEAQGLFQRAILQSGAVSMSMTRSEGTKLAQYLLQLTGTSDMSGLMALTSQDLQNATKRLQDALNFPELDGVVLTSGDIYEAFARNSANFDILIGSDADEVRYFMAAAGSLETYSQYMTMAYEQITDAVSSVPVYGEQLLDAAETFIALQGDTETVWAYSEFMNDLLFRVPAITMAQAHAGNTYMYYWNIPTVVPGFGACHGSELPYVFGNPSALVPEQVLGSGQGQALSALMQAMWVDFAEDGVLEGRTKYTADTMTTIVLSADAAVVSEVNDPLSEQRQLMTPFMQLGISGRDIINALYGGVSPEPEPEPEPEIPSESDDVRPGSPSGGCDGGMTMVMLVMVIPVVLRKRR